MRCVKSGLISAGLIAICALATGTELSRAARAQEVLTKSGWFHVLWGDDAGGANSPTLKYFLVDDLDDWTELNLDHNSGETLASLLEFDRKRVEVVGERLDSTAVTLNLRKVTLEELSGEAVETDGVIGTKRWVTILCRFADSTSITPAPASYFNGLMSSTYPGMNHYWSESSYGSINLNGSLVVGWFNLPNPWSYYVYDRNNDGRLDFDFERAVAGATAVADSAVFFPDFYGINFIFNQQLDGASWGGGAAVNKDGTSRVYGATFMPPSAFGNQVLMAHEMGHGFGLPHSSGPYSATYDSQWDPMSGGGTCSPTDANYGCLGVHTISYHKDKLGWIAPGRKYLAPSAGSATINLERLGQPLFGNNYLMAQITIGGEPDKFYTVEARRFPGYDNQIPGEAIVIHNVSINRGDRAAQVVDADSNGDPNDAGARWTPGETFSDVARGIQVTVNSMDASSFNVSISVTQAGQTLQFGQAGYSTTEGAEIAVVNVTRSGDTSGTASVDYVTSDGTARQRTDYTMASGTLSFAAGETSKTLSVLIADNAYVDGSRTINLGLSNPTGATMGAPNEAVLTISDNDSAAPATNPIDEAQFFVRQHYYDFLNRVPDAGGLAYWSDQITQCGTNLNCINARRIGVSAAYFVELEFQHTGSYVYCLNKASYGQRPTYAQFMPDRSRLIGGLDLDLSKQAFAEVWVKRPEFTARYPVTLSGTEFIDSLLQTAQAGAGINLSDLRTTLIADFVIHGSRARIVHLVAENQNFRLAEYNRAFVLMEYFGYLRRDPDESGYQFWLEIVNNRVPNNYRSMVCAFLTSAEYQERFSSVRTRSDSTCSQAQ